MLQVIHVYQLKGDASFGCVPDRGYITVLRLRAYLKVRVRFKRGVMTESQT